MIKVSDPNGIFNYFMKFLNMERGHKVDFRLDRIRRILDEMGSPDKILPCLHVAGSKGKGSVSTMLSSILESHGLMTGLYTSPHIIDFRERITRSQQFLSDEIYLRAFSHIQPILELRKADDFIGNEYPSFFELMTILAFLCFREGSFDTAVYEVGLGGRLDSTNVILPEATIITSIELEHTEWLGTTYREIAFEKAGTIKTNKPVFTSASNPDALEVFREISNAKSSKLFILNEEVKLNDVCIDYTGTSAIAEFTDSSVHPSPVRINTPLIGKIQVENAALSILVSRLSSFNIPIEQCLDGIKNASLPARFQIVSRDPLIVVDGAHTPESVRNVIDTWNRLSLPPGILLFACAIDKKHSEIANILKPFFKKTIITKPGDFKKCDINAVVKSFDLAGFDSISDENTENAISTSITLAQKEKLPLLITGSFYLCAEVLNKILKF